MTTILWMLYLTALLFHSLLVIGILIEKLNQSDATELGFKIFISVLTCLMWAIWYMYYLN